MKDDRLEKEFDEYFKGVNISDNITADAKKSVKNKRSMMPKMVKFLSIAASIVLVFAVSLAVILRTDFNKVTDNTPPNGNTSDNEGNLPAGDPSDGNGSGNSGGDNPSGAPDSPSGGAKPDLPDDGDSSSGAVKFVFYSDDDLDERDSDAYSISSLNPSLKIIENFALADNASVETCTAGYMDGKLALVKAEINILNGLNRDETTVYVEFTDTNLIYSGLKDYYDGKVSYYHGAEYYLTATTGENGEPEFKLHVLYDGLKYYFNVHSSDVKAYEKYLNLIVKK